MCPGRVGSAFAVCCVHQAIIAAVCHGCGVLIRNAAGLAQLRQCPHAESVCTDLGRHIRRISAEILELNTAHVSRNAELSRHIVPGMNAEGQTANVCDGSRGHVVGGIAKAGQLVSHVLNGCLCSHGCINVRLQ